MNKEIRIIRRCLMLVMASLVLSGLTAIPLEQGLEYLISHFPFEGTIKGFLRELLVGIRHTARDFPFLFYGFDWLAFAHFALAILFIGPLRDPVKNRWVVEFGVITCILVIPFALLAGHFRGMPFWWRLIDCSFGIIGLVPLVICLNNIRKSEAVQKEEMEKKDDYNLMIA